MPFAALGFLILGAAVYVQRIGWATSTFTNDELWGVIGGRLLEQDFLFFATDVGHFNRGPERLVSVLQVPSNALFASTVDALRGSHVVLALVYFSVAVPVYALSRGIGLGRWTAVLTAALVVVTPWAVFGATLLTVTVALPTNMLLVWAAWRAAVRPSLLGDVLVLVAAGVNALARTGHAPFAVVAIFAVTYAVWLRRPDGEPAGRSLLRLPVRIARTHSLLVAVTALVVLVVLRLGLDTVVGSAYQSANEIRLPWDSLWFHLRDWFMQLTMATGYLPVMIGAPWLAWQVVRPATPAIGVFAVVALGLFLTFVYVTSTHNSVSEERYVAVLAGLPAIAFVAALARREARPLATLVLGLLLARALATLSPFNFPSGSYVSYQIAPARMFFEQVLLGRTGLVVPGDDSNVLTAATLAIVAVAVAVAVAASPFRPRLPSLPLPAWLRLRAAVAAPLAVLAFGAMSGGWAIQTYRDSLPPETMASMDWIDEVSGGEQVFLWSHFSPERREGPIYIGLLNQFFNESVCCTLWLNDVQDLLGPRGELPAEPVRYVAQLEGFSPLGFDADVVARREYAGETMRVLRFDGPARAAVRVEGIGLDGRIAAGQEAVLRLLPAGRGKCLKIKLSSAADATALVAYGVAGAASRASGTLAPGARRTEIVRPSSSKSIAVRARGAEGSAVQLGDISVARC